MTIVQLMQKFDVQEKQGKHAGSYRTRFAGKYSAIAKAKQELGPHVLDRKTKAKQRFQRYTKLGLIEMISDMEEHIEELEKQVYIICVAQLNVLFNLMCSVSHCFVVQSMLCLKDCNQGQGYQNHVGESTKPDKCNHKHDGDLC